MNRMPALFIGHGSPMNAIETNLFTEGWKDVAKDIPRPKGIISISAHWFTAGTKIMDDESPKTIHDMYGFPPALYRIMYEAPGYPELAARARKLITRNSDFDDSWE